MGIVTLVGERQSGKTTALTALATSLIGISQKVMYVTIDMQQARSVLLGVEDMVSGDDSYTVTRGNGRERVTHISGGELMFGSPGSQRGRGVEFDTLILDEVNVYPNVPTAKNVYHAPMALELY